LCRSISDSFGACNLRKRHIEHQHHSGNINGIVFQRRGTNLDPSAVVNTCLNLRFQLSGCTNPARIQVPMASVVVTISTNSVSASAVSLYGAQFTFPRIVVGNTLQISENFPIYLFYQELPTLPSLRLQPPHPQRRPSISPLPLMRHFLP
jgi:hypothetical protein